MATFLTTLRERAADWLAQGPDYRARLQQERHEHMARIRAAAELSVVEDPHYAQHEGTGLHPILQLTERRFGSGVRHDAQLLVYHAMREYLPTLGSAITNRRALEGDVRILSEDEGLQERLREWAEQVSVGYMTGNGARKGLNTYLHQLADSADEYGLSVGEIVTDEDGTEIERLVVPSSQTLSLEEQQATHLYRLVQHQDGTRQYLDDKPLVQVCSFTFGTDDPWPRPLAWNLIQSGEVLLRMYEAIEQGWWRFGDPSLLNVIEHPDADAKPEMVSVEGIQVPRAILRFKDSMEQVMRARRRGKVGDVYAFSGAGGQVRSEVIGDIDNSLMKFFSDHRHEFQSDIIGTSNTPAWMYPGVEGSGELGSSRANNQGMVYASDAQKRNRKKMAIARKVLDTHLLVSGDAQWIGQYELEAEAANLLDEGVIQEARERQASADAQFIENSMLIFNEGDQTSADGSMRLTPDQQQYLENRDVI